MSDAESDGDIWHADGMSHSRRKSCAICAQEHKNQARAQMPPSHRRGAELLDEITRAITENRLPDYLAKLATKLIEAEGIAMLNDAKLKEAYKDGVEDERHRIRNAIQ